MSEKKELKYKNNNINNKTNKNFCEINFPVSSVQKSFNGYIFFANEEISSFRKINFREFSQNLRKSRKLFSQKIFQTK